MTNIAEHVWTKAETNIDLAIDLSQKKAGLFDRGKHGLYLFWNPWDESSRNVSIRMHAGQNMEQLAALFEGSEPPFPYDAFGVARLTKRGRTVGRAIVAGMFNDADAGLNSMSLSESRFNDEFTPEQRNALINLTDFALEAASAPRTRSLGDHAGILNPFGY